MKIYDERRKYENVRGFLPGEVYVATNNHTDPGGGDPMYVMAIKGAGVVVQFGHEDPPGPEVVDLSTGLVHCVTDLREEGFAFVRCDAELTVE